MDQSGVLLEKRGGMATITLNRPNKRNALSAAMRAALAARLADVAADREVSVVLLRGEGSVFCGGIDVSDLPDDPMVWRERVLGAQANHLAIVRMSKIVIASVQGAAIGGGASLALAADFLVMADSARLSFPFVKLGIVPDGGVSYFLQAKLGTPLALDLLLTGGTLDSSDAVRLGLTRRVVPEATLLDASRELAADLLKLPAEALMLTKSLCRQYWGERLDSVLAHEADAFGLATATKGHKNAIAALRRKTETTRQK